jgi:signal transduction histidine kinase
VIISMLAGYMLERGIRTAFVQRRLIESQRLELAYHNAELDSALQSSLDEVRRKADELAASRARIVAAADAERRRIERNLHDGAQQRLVALAVRVGLVAKLVEQDQGAAEAALLELRTEVQETLQELRTLAHGIYPPLLMDRGLEPALRAAAQRSALPAMVLAEGLGRYRPETEATVYFCCLEAMQNACKHAGANASVVVNIREDRGGIRFEVIDDGAGFDVAGNPTGSGFVNMSDRLGAIGGSLDVQSAPGRGTRVIGWLPAVAEPNGHVDDAPAPGEVATPSPAG